MKTMMNLMLIAMTALFFAACGDDPLDETETDSASEVETDTNVDITPITDLNTLVGKRFYILLDSQYWNQPNMDIGNDIGSRIPAFIVQFASVDVTNLTFTALFGIGDTTGAQDMCNKTYDVTGTFGTSAAGSTTFVFNQLDVQMIIAGNDEDTDGIPTKKIAPIHNFSIGGTFVNQGARFKEGEINALLDARDVACMFTILDVPTADNFCTRMAADFAYACEACVYTGAPVGNYCVTLGAEAFRIDADPIGTAALTPVADFTMSCIQDTCTAK